MPIGVPVVGQVLRIRLLPLLCALMLLLPPPPLLLPFDLRSFLRGGAAHRTRRLLLLLRSRRVDRDTGLRFRLPGGADEALREVICHFTTDLCASLGLQELRRIEGWGGFLGLRSTLPLSMPLRLCLSLALGLDRRSRLMRWSLSFGLGLRVHEASACTPTDGNRRPCWVCVRG